MDYKQTAAELIKLVGGKENISLVKHCWTRVRFTLKDDSKADKNAVEAVKGVMKVIIAAGMFQVVVGSGEVDPLTNEIISQLGMETETKQVQTTPEPEKENVKKKKVMDVILEYVMAIMMPLMPMFIAGGILRGVLSLVSNYGLLEQTSGAYILLYAAAWGFMYFTPVILACFAAKKFGCNQVVAMGLGAALIYPNVVSALAEGITFAGISVRNVTYSNSIFPIILTVWVLSYVEKGLKKVIKNRNVQTIIVPFFSLVIMTPLMFLVFGPIGGYIGDALAKGYNFVLTLNPIICGAVIGLCWQILIMFGMHMSFVPIMVQEFSSMGISTFCAFYSASSWCQYVAPLGVALKTKNKELRTECISLALTGITGTAVEPCLYGINLRFKKPFIIAVIGGTLGGAIAGATGAFSSGMSYFGIYTWSLYLASGLWKMLLAVGVSCVFTIVATYLFGYNDSMLKEEK